MDTRKPETTRVDKVDEALLIPKTPDLSLRKLDRVVSFRLPKHHRRDSEADDLPDLTPELISRLNAQWAQDELGEQKPIRILINALRDHMDAINPYVEAIRDVQRSWLECWQFLYKIAQNLDQASEADENTRFYSMPDSLRMQELRARMNIGKDDAEWEIEKEKYTNEIDKRHAELAALDSKIKQITEAKDIATLNKFAAEPLRFASGAQRGGGAHQAKGKPGCLSYFFSLFARRGSAPVPQPAVNPTADQNAMESLRAKLLTQFNEELKFKTNLTNDYAENMAPKKKDNYRREWKEVKAKILHHQIDFYRCQTKDVMLHCIRLYVLAFRTYYMMYGDNPLVDEDKSAAPDPKQIKRIYDQDDKVVLKAKELFRQMIKGMKSQLGLFYCLQPDRCDFMTYLDNYNNIPKQEERDAILAGKGTPEMLEKVFPEFEAPSVAFDYPRLGQ